MSESSSWSETRREIARLQAERLAERKAAESLQARAFLEKFVTAALTMGPAPVPLRVHGRTGNSAATTLSGWYLKVDESVAVDTSGNYYLLQMDLSFLDRFRRLTPTPTAPPLVLGAGGRDGETMDLTARLTQLQPKWREVEAD
ncbi:hypothetical protein FYJ24_04120 [Actinomycetaceae bacterium WB03_NA08]|uniref:Uncharacterized protein n=1 Tax=Scrofimicrobium canadense TaxID=2652290 RepID=A0A6N7W643_9ACTO|nr:hypothetical protein [Scrofimicrobium canadense]MSS83963.1 hypothetical protein [Scrofimicrobium canadense]